MLQFSQLLIVALAVTLAEAYRSSQHDADKRRLVAV
jgi:hypothetical protein